MSKTEQNLKSAFPGIQANRNTRYSKKRSRKA